MKRTYTTLSAINPREHPRATYCVDCGSPMKWNDLLYYACPSGCGEWWPRLYDDDGTRGITIGHIAHVLREERKRGKRGGGSKSGKIKRKPLPPRRPYELP